MKKIISIFLIFTLLITLGISCFADDVIVVDPDSTPSPTPAEETLEPSASPEATATPTPTTDVLFPVVTKPPYDENVYTGDRIVFVARADNATSITWYLISPDGTSTILASSIPSLFPGVNVTGSDSEKLVISPATTKLSGYKAFARFGNENGFSDSASASITVTINPNPSPSPTASAVPTPSPVPSAVAEPSATPAIAETPVPTSAPQVTPMPTTTPSTNTTSRSFLGFGTILLLILCVLVIVGSAIMLSMYVKGTIDLSWLENIFSKEEKKKGSKPSKPQDTEVEENIDIPQSFYDPDDFKK